MAHIGNAPFGKTVRTVTSETLTSVKTAYYPTGGYIVGYVDVYVNGVRLTETADFTATDGTTVTLLYNPSIGDTVDVVTYGSIELANAVRRDGDTLVGTLYTRALVPTANVTYDIGTSTMRYRDLFLSGNTINLGDIQLTANSTSFRVSNTTGGTFPSSLANTTISGTLAANATTITGNVSITGAAFTNGTITVANSSQNTVFITTSGNLGLNVASPTLKLEAYDSSNTATGFNFRNNNAGSGTQVNLQLGNDGATNRAGLALFGTQFNNSALYYKDSLYVYNNSANGGIYIHSENGAPIVLGVSSAQRLSVNTTGVYISGNNTVGGMTIVSNHESGTGSVLRLSKANTTTQAYLSVNSDEVYVGAAASNSTYGIIGSKANVAIQVGYTDRAFFNNSGAGMVLKGKYCVDFSTGITNYTTVNPSHSVLLQGSPNDRDCWIYLDPADTASNWGIYHRNVDTAVGSAPGNSIAFIGGGNNGIKGYINLMNGTWGIGNNAVEVYSAGVPSGGLAAASDYLWFRAWNSTMQRTSYDRGWDNYPSVTVQNTTDVGPQGEYRIHGSPGVNGGDFSVVTRSDGGYATGSDQRRKTNIENITGALATVMQLTGKKFNIINSEGVLDPMRGEKKQFGLIAQDSINIIPEAVSFYPEADTPNENGWASAYSIEYQSLVPLLIEAVKEQQLTIEQLQNDINVLKG